MIFGYLLHMLDLTSKNPSENWCAQHMKYPKIIMRAPVHFFLVRLWKDSKLPNPIYHRPSTSKYQSSSCACHGFDGRPGREGCKYTPYCMKYVTYSIKYLF